MRSISRLFAGLDDFGHRYPLTYKGSDSYQTAMGGMASALIKVLTLTMIVVYFKSMWLMEDPEIISFSRPLSKQEKDELGPINFGEQGFYLGVVTYVNAVPAHIPPEVGKLASYAVKRV